jgi:hypothetical protein
MLVWPKGSASVYVLGRGRKYGGPEYDEKQVMGWSSGGPHLHEKIHDQRHVFGSMIRHDRETTCRLPYI